MDDGTQRAILEWLEAIDKRFDRIERSRIVRSPIDTIAWGAFVGLIAASLVLGLVSIGLGLR